MTLITRLWNEDRIVMIGDDQLNCQGRRIAGASDCKIIFLKDLNSVIGISGNLRENDYNFKDLLKGIYTKKHYSCLVEYLEQVKDYFTTKKPEELKEGDSLLMASTFEKRSPKNYSIIFKFTDERYAPVYFNTPVILSDWYDFQTCRWVDHNLKEESDLIDP